jgi:hypothetical protein
MSRAADNTSRQSKSYVIRRKRVHEWEATSKAAITGQRIGNEQREE